MYSVPRGRRYPPGKSSSIVACSLFILLCIKNKVRIAPPGDAENSRHALVWYLLATLFVTIRLSESVASLRRVQCAALCNDRVADALSRDFTDRIVTARAQISDDGSHHPRLNGTQSSSIPLGWRNNRTDIDGGLMHRSIVQKIPENSLGGQC